jgi:hypothetical protein
MMKKLIFSSILFFAFANLFAQVGEQIVPLTINPIQASEYLKRASSRNSNSAIASILDTIALPSTGLRDNFSYDSHRPDTTLWFDVTNAGDPTGVFVNRTWAIAPINLGVCTFDGLDYKGQPYDSAASVNSNEPCDELVSRWIDLSPYTVADSVYLSFWYEAKGRGYAPNTSDSFLLDFNIPAWDPNSLTHVWKNIWYKEGYNPSFADTNFHLVLIKLDSASYFTKGFRFRFRNWASACGSNDHWHLDEVYLKSNRNMFDTIPGDVAFVYPPSSGLTDFWSVPHTHYKPTMMAANYDVPMRNNDIIARNITYWYYAYDESHTQYYQYPNASGAVYNNFDTYWNSGYGNLASVTNPGIGFNFPQTAINLDSGTYEVKHVLKQNATTIDTCTTEQKFYNYYAYDDGTAETGYGLYGSNSSLAYKFTLPVGISDTLKAIQMYFLPVQNLLNLEPEEFYLTVWGDQANQPGTIIYQEKTHHVGYNFETPDKFISYGIDSGTVVLAGTFYIGWQQLGIDRMYIGMDFNDDHHDKIYYNTTGNWNTSIFTGSLMMRPVFGDNYDASGINENSLANNFSIYPNPANDQVTISGIKEGQGNLTTSILDISGREIISAQKLNADNFVDVSSLSAGLYLLQLKNEHGDLIGTQRLVISE